MYAHHQAWPAFIFAPSFVYLDLGHIVEGILQKMDKGCREYDAYIQDEQATD